MRLCDYSCSCESVPFVSGWIAKRNVFTKLSFVTRWEKVKRNLFHLTSPCLLSSQSSWLNVVHVYVIFQWTYTVPSVLVKRDGNNVWEEMRVNLCGCGIARVCAFVCVRVCVLAHVYIQCMNKLVHSVCMLCLFRQLSPCITSCQSFTIFHALSWLSKAFHHVLHTGYLSRPVVNLQRGNQSALLVRLVTM